MVHTWNEQKNAQGIYTKNKSCIWPLSSLYKTKYIYIYVCACVTATRSPPNLYSKTLLPSEKSYRIQYITFCFTSLELQNERAGNRNKNLPSLHWIWFSVAPHRNQREQLNCIFSFLFFVYLLVFVVNDNFPPCLIFTCPLALSSEGPGRRIKAWSLLSRFSSLPLVCLWWRRLWREQHLHLPLPCCSGSGSGLLRWCQTRWPGWDQPDRSSAGKGRWRTPHLERRGRSEKQIFIKVIIITLMTTSHQSYLVWSVKGSL